MDEANIKKEDVKDFGYQESPELQMLSASLKDKHDKQYMPLGQAIIGGMSPQATPNDRVAAGDAMKKLVGTDEPQWGNFFQSLINGNVRDMVISVTGGSDRPSQAYGPDGSTWTKVFNERGTKVNPQGEVRFYVDANGKKYSREEAEKIAGGPITSIAEIPLQSQNFYKAQGITQEAAARAQSTEWNARQTAASAALRNAPAIVDASIALDQIYKNEKVIKASVNKDVKQLIYGISNMRTGDSRSLQQAVEKFKQFEKGQGTKQEYEDYRRQNGGLNLPITYNEGKGVKNSDGTTFTSNDLERNVETLKKNASSENAISSRKEDLMAKAQLVAAGDMEIASLLQQAVNLEYQKSLAVKKIEDVGGIGIAQPNLRNEVGDDFVLTGVKNKLAKNYGQLAQEYGNQILGMKSEYQHRVPAIGEVDQRINSNERIRQIKDDNTRDALNYSREMTPFLRSLTPQSPTEVVSQPSVNLTAPVSAPAASVAPPPEKPRSAAPPKSVSPKSSTNNKKILSSIFGN